MKKLLTFVAIALLLQVPISTMAQGGPDAFGYTWITSLNAGGPTYNWIDITTLSGVQTVTGLADDNSAAGMLNLGFNFHYYWSDYNQIKIGSNGWIAFNNASNIASCFPTIPTAGGSADNYLAPLMSDLNFTGAGNPAQVKYWTNNIDTFIVSYINIPFWAVSAPGWTGSNSFQVIFCGNDSSIVFQYASLSAFQNNAACIDMTVGIENSTGAIGLQVHSDVSPPSNYAIRFDAPTIPLLSIQDVLPLWNNNTENEALILLENVAYPLISNLHNAGNADVTDTCTLQADILNASLASIYSDTNTISSLAAGVDSLISFDSWTAVSPGLYTFKTTSSCSQDINPANNTNQTALLAVDGCNPSMTLSYVSNNTPTGNLNWNGGANDDGAAVYFLPPVYPYTVTSLEYYITSNVGEGFTAAVFDDDGPNGAAGTQLFTFSVAAASVVSSAWNIVNIGPTLTINDGGYYVAWYQGGTSIFLGTQNAGPYAHQGYEILDGSWAKLRYGINTDICIRSTISGYSMSPHSAFNAGLTSPLNYAFTDNSTGNIISRAWDFGDGVVSTLQHPAHTYVSEGSYTVCLITTSICGDKDTACQVVEACVPPVVTSDPAAGIVCAGFATSFIMNADSAGLSYQWQEDQGAGFVDLTETPPYSGIASAQLTINVSSPAMNGYIYRCIISKSCGFDTTAGALLTVHSLPVVSLDPISNICIDQPAFALTGGSPAGGDYVGTGVSAGFFDAATAGPGLHVINYIYTDAHGCIDSAQQDLNVILCTAVEQQEKLGASVTVYPNPSSGMITIHSDLISPVLEIYDACGTLKLSLVMTGSSMNIDLRPLAGGLYLIRMTSANEVRTGRLVLMQQD